LRPAYMSLQIQNYGGMSNHEIIIHTLEVQMPSLNQVTKNVVFGKIVIVML
jgi:hypothetical protein